MALTVSGLQVSIGKAHILHDINFQVKDGEFFSLLGNSGCGKSTLLKTIAGLVQEQDGEIAMDGVALHELPAQKRKTAIVFQDIRLFPSMTVGENVAYPLRLKRVPKVERIRRVDELLELVHLPGFGARRVHELSGGQSQRIAIARALAAEPSMLLLDEPFSALDENLRESMRSFVAEVHQRTGLMTIMVTHNQHEAMAMSDCIAVMDAGQIVQVGAPAEIYNKPANLKIAKYLADGDMLTGTANEGVFRCGGLELPCDVMAPSVVAIIRPLAVSVGQGLPFRVVELKYQGQTYEATLDNGGARLHVQVDADAGTRVGDEIAVAIDVNRVMFFADEGE
ncbi:ATP-binding cassette domain-containing protein [Eggerthellaceae bacterium zg-893]|nr:ATP-binding cassette domain-containing protein [Eggerthellaceae bacterium zg-893]